MINLQRLDLNLLRTTDVLLSENNVTRAAQRLNLSQPSVSIQLARLREIFADPLLMPGPRGMQPTARADELRQPLRAALAALEQAVAPVSPFDPATAAELAGGGDGLYGLGDPPADAGWITPGLSRQSAGGIRITAGAAGAAGGQRYSRSLLSYPRGRAAGAASAPAVSRTLRAGWPGGTSSAAAGLSTETFCQLEHVIVSPDGGGFSAATDIALANLGLTRRVVLSVPHFLFMLETLRNSDLVAVLPERLVRGQSGLVVVEPPLAVAGFEMLMLWHERWHRDPAHQWLRQFIVNSLEEQTC